MGCAVIFGGTGFIGTFFAVHLMGTGRYTKVYLYDRERLEDKKFPYRRKLIAATANIEIVIGDVREDISWTPEEPVSLIANFAAVHREPGHEPVEYYETNLKGAENVTAWAERVGCSDLIFTSSISPYGISESTKDESTLPVPLTAYGGSKLAAEKIHLAWQAANASGRRLVIVRPGVVFGPGEGGNVTRLVKAVRGGYFSYMGNRDTRKAGIYVKELCNAIWWVYQRQQAVGEKVSLFNGSMNPGPSIQEYVQAVSAVAGVKRFVPSIPYGLLLGVSYGLEIIAKPLKISHPFSPVRIRKLVRSNNILPSFLVKNGYSYKYTLEQALVDWRECSPEDWS